MRQERRRERKTGSKRQLDAEEHSIENQLPLLQTPMPEHAEQGGRPGGDFLPIGVGSVDPMEAEKLADDLAALIEIEGLLGEGDRGVAALGTTDFSHEGPFYGGPVLPTREITRITREKDDQVLKAMEIGDVEMPQEKGRQISMCGLGAACVLLHLGDRLGLRKRRMLKYLVNTEVHRDCSSTAGFAAFLSEWKSPR